MTAGERSHKPGDFAPDSLSHLQPLVGQHVTRYQVWEKQGESSWHGKFEERPDIGKAFAEADQQIKEAAGAFGRSFKAHHPEYDGMVGIRGTHSNWRNNQPQLVQGALGHLWRRHHTFQLGDAEVDAVVEEFAAFVDSPTIRLLFQTQLLNFRTVTDSLDFPGGLRVRRLSEEEVSSYHGGPIETLGFIRPRSSSMHEFVIEGEIDEPKLLGDNHPAGVMLAERVKTVLDKAILVFRTFKEGHIGYDYVHFKPLRFCPLPLGARGAGDLYVPFGSYSFGTEEVEPLGNHARLIFACSETAMEMACSRLADAEHRNRPQDRAVDAVIGMEALLLAGLSKEDRRGELSYRFSMRYAALFGSPEERYAAFRTARDLYNLRSTIAHGSAVEGVHRVGDEKQLSLPEAAKRAASALRLVIRRFLPEAKSAPYKKPEFWDRALFGLAEPR